MAIEITNPVRMSMSSRSFSLQTKYWYGFNTQEKDLELGQDIYTAEFWEYDAKLGRRWNVDPVTKFNISNYCVLHNSPSLFIDLLGVDDFFDSKGKYLGNYGTDCKIRVVNEGVTFEDAQNDISGLTKLIASFDYSKYNGLENRKVLKNIVNHYAKQVGISDGKVGSGYYYDRGTPEENPSVLMYYNTKDGYITVSI